MHLWTASAPAVPLDVRDSIGGGNGTLQTDQVVTLPTNQSGDIVYIAMRLGTTLITLTDPTGWTSLISYGDPRTYCYRRVMDGTEPATVTFVASGTGTRTSWVAFSVQGAAVGEAIFEQVGSVTTTEDPSSVTASWGAANSLALTFLGARTATWTATPPTGYGGTEMGDTTPATATNSTSTRTYGAYRAISAASEDAGAWTITTGVTNSPRVWTVLVRPS
jgi:hypothetical protein